MASKDKARKPSLTARPATQGKLQRTLITKHSASPLKPATSASPSQNAERAVLSKTASPPGTQIPNTLQLKSSLPLVGRGSGKVPLVAANGRSNPLASTAAKTTSARPPKSLGDPETVRGAPSAKPAEAKRGASEGPGKVPSTNQSGSSVPAPVAEHEEGHDAAADDFVVPIVEYIKPPNQLQLLEKELAEEFARTLNVARPGPARLIVRYNLDEKSYKAEPQLEQVMLHFSLEGSLLHRDGEEGQKLAKSQAAEDEAEAAAASQAGSATDGEAAAEGAGSGRPLRNQFNFSERGAQTSYFPPRERGTNPEAPPTTEASGECSRWEIYNAYIADQQQQRQQEAVRKQGLPGKGWQADEESENQGEAITAADVLQAAALRRSLKLVERMSTQNTLLDVILDFKYWDDEADLVRSEEGTLLPLWRLSTTLASRKQVTAVAWSTGHSDLLVAAFGSFDFQMQTSGLVAGFSLKNPASPEFCFHFRPGVMSLHLHPQHSNLLAVGCYDGSVAVFDVSSRQEAALLYSSTPKSGHHTRPVWAVEWQAAQPAMPSVFHSLSSDGRVLLWTLGTAELTCQEVVKLKQAPQQGLKPDEEPSRPTLAAGCCLDFHPVQDFVFVVGTEEGAIYKCSTAYSTEYLLTYAGHDMAVYAVRWNRVHPATFISSSADWTVKLWHSDSQKAVMSFSLGSPVGDVTWSPFSATIFAAVTDAGLARVFDLYQNSAEPLCEQRIVAKAGLTRIAFNSKHPILVVGDNSGHLVILKLSPNLRKYSSAGSSTTRTEEETAKLDAVLEVARESAEAVSKASMSQTSMSQSIGAL